MSSSDPVITVAIPAFKAKPIAWLALEGLARQVDAPPWELMFLEEADELAVGKDLLDSYAPQLREAGCGYIRYRSIADWIPLSQKWRLLGLAAMPSSQLFLLHGCDDYSPSDRLARTWEYAKHGDWIQDTTGLFYDIATCRLSVFDLESEGYRGVTGQNMATRTELIRDLPLVDVKRGVDGWLLRQVQERCGGEVAVVGMREGGPSLATDGFNVCSRVRYSMYERPPFSLTTDPLSDFMPDEIAERLAGLQVPALVNRFRAHLEDARDAFDAALGRAEEMVRSLG